MIERLPAEASAVPGLLEEQAKEAEEVESYLESVAAALDGEVHTASPVGYVVPKLVDCARRHQITHVVLASHGRTALSRVVLGSVADELIHELRCGIVVIPALAPGRLEEHDQQLTGSGTRAGGSRQTAVR